MATYIILGQWTAEGIKSAKDTTDRSDKAAELAQQFGGSLTNIYWTLGKHDFVAIVEFPDDASFAAWGLKLAGQGNVRTQSMRAFSRSEMQGIIDRS